MCQYALHNCDTVCLSRLAGKKYARREAGTGCEAGGTRSLGRCRGVDIAEVRRRGPLLTALGPHPGTEVALVFTIGAARLGSRRPPLQRGILSLLPTAGQQASFGLFSSSDLPAKVQVFYNQADLNAQQHCQAIRHTLRARPCGQVLPEGSASSHCRPPFQGAG